MSDRLSPKKAGPSPKKAGPSPKKAGPSSKKAGTSPKKAGPSPKKAGSSSNKVVMGKSSTKQAQFKSGTINDGKESIIYATNVGWVNKPVILGVLSEVNEGENRVVFEFHDGKKIYNAWSATDWKKKNMKLLKPGYHYVVEGTIFIETISKKYFRSTNSNLGYSVRLSEIKVVKKTIVKTSFDVDEPVKEIKKKIEKKQSCNQVVKDVKLVAGNLRRYMGCEVCHAGIPKAGSDGNFRCQRKCKDKRKRDRMVCVVITNMKIEDEHGHQLENIICYHKECEELFGSKLFQQVCGDSSDLKAKKRFSKFFGSSIDSARIKNQKPSGSQTKPFNDWKLVIENIVLKTQDDSEDEETGPKKSTLVPTATSERDGNICPCFLDEDDQDDVYLVTSTTITPEPSTSGSEQTSSFVLDSEGRYDISPASDGFIGLALLINMSFVPDKKKYPGACSNERSGSNNDVETLMTLLPSIRIRVFKDKPFLDINKEEFRTLLKEFKEELLKMEYSCLFFIIMSHGILFHIRLRDMSRINVYRDILSEFSDKKFPQFSGKPKICILNACQYFYASDVKDMTGMLVDDTEIYPDMLVCTPCAYGVKAKRHVRNGSYFIQELAKVLKDKWQSMHFEAIMKEVQQKMSPMRFGKKKDAANIPEYKPILFKYPFYFTDTPENATESVYDILY